MKLTKAVISNLFSFGDIEIDIIDGKLLLLGVNQDEDGLDSNGSGKSNLLNSIYWVQYGKFLDKRNSDEVLRRGTNFGKGVLTYDDGTTVERSVKANGTKILKLNGEKSDVSNTKVQGAIDELLGCDAKGFLHSHYMSADFSNAFVGKDTTPKERFAVFEKFIDVELLNKAREFCNKQISVNREEALKLEGKVSGFGELVKNIDRERIATALKKIEEEIVIIDETIKDMGDTLNEMRNLKEKHSEYKLIKEKMDRLDKLKKERDDTYNSGEFSPESKFEPIEPNKREIERIKSIINKKYYTCPTCGDKLVMGKDNLKRAEDADIGALKEKMTELTAETKLLEEKRRAEQSLQDLLDDYNKRIKYLTEEIGENPPEEVEFDEDKYIEVQKRDAQLISDHNILIMARHTHQEKIKNYDTAKKNLASVKKEIKEHEERIKKYSFWAEGFKQIKAMRIDSIIPLFEEEANKILASWFESGMEVKFSTTRELKSGGERIELNVNVIDPMAQERSFESCSMGQKSRIAIAVTLARREIFGDESNIDFLMVDELLDGLDQIGQRKFIDVINNLPYQMFIVSHSDFFKNSFEDSITICMENGVSRIVTK